MSMKHTLVALAALFSIGAAPSAGAQQVYKCASRSGVVYSQLPCSKKAVNTDPADVPVKPNSKEADLRRKEQNRVMARSMRPREGESAEQFEVRRRRAPLMPEDRAECARIDTRMPVEAASLTNPDPAEVAKAEAALAASKKRFAALRC
jgi:hypothetical protein